MFNNLSLHSCVSMARDKLHSAASHGPRDDIRLCRWVLLKNSLTNAISRSTEPSPPSSANTPRPPAPGHYSPAPPAIEQEFQFETFLFPDGDVFAESFSANEQFAPDTTPEVEDLGSEALWLDSLLESLSEDNDADSLVVPAPAYDEEDEDSDLASLLDLPSFEDFVSSAPESVRLPPSPPLPPYTPGPAAHPLYSNGGLGSYSLSELSDDLESLAPPDVIEDSYSDTDSESITTPFTRSFSSFSEGANLSAGAMRPLVHIVDPSAVYAFSEERIPRDLISEPYEPQEC